MEKINTECQAWKYINKYRNKKEGVSEKISIEEWVKHFREALGGREERIQIVSRKIKRHGGMKKG